MKEKYLRRIAFGLAGFCIAGFCGCADTLPDNGEPSKQQGGEGGGSDIPIVDDQGRDICTSEECRQMQEDIDNNICPNVDYKSCAPDGKTLRKCDSNMKIIEETCADACIDNKCATFSGNSCSKPYIATIGQARQGSTSSGETFSSIPMCSGKIKPMMGVFKFTVPEGGLGFYDISILSASTTNWGYVLTQTCPPQSAFVSNCDVAGKQDSFKKLLSPGDYYLLASPATIFATNFDATLQVSRFDYASSPLCGSYGGTPTFVEFKDNFYETSGDTAMGKSSVRWDDSEGCANSASNSGKDNAYIFSLTEESVVTATLRMESEIDDTQHKIAVYIDKCNNGSRHTTKTCTVSGTRTSIATNTLKVGEYILFVDSNDKDFKYKLQIKIAKP